MLAALEHAWSIYFIRAQAVNGHAPRHALPSPKKLRSPSSPARTSQRALHIRSLPLRPRAAPSAPHAAAARTSISITSSSLPRAWHARSRQSLRPSHTATQSGHLFIHTTVALRLGPTCGTGMILDWSARGSSHFLILVIRGPG